MKDANGIIGTRCVTLGDHEPLNIQQLQNVNSDQSYLIIQIYAHGGPAGIAHTPTGELIRWEEVIQLVSNCRSNYPVRLDLLGICESKYIANYLNSQSRIDRIWINTELTFWQSVYNTSRKSETLDILLNDMMEDYENALFIQNYREITWRP